MKLSSQKITHIYQFLFLSQTGANSIGRIETTGTQ
jgi:hypothetical protein